MRCSEARQRLIRLRGQRPDDAEGRKLLRHLKDCPACAAFARAEQALARDLAAGAADDIADDIPLSTLKTRVESRVRLAGHHQAKENSIMGALTGQLKKRPRLGISVGVFAVVLALATLIPFTIEQTIGYEVALAGVDKGLALDDDKVNELLAALGVENATYDVGDCEATCKIKISDLKSENDVQLVVAAFDELGDCVLEEVRTISGDESGSLLNHAQNIIFVRSKLEHLESGEDAEIHEIVLDRLSHLDSCSEGTFNIWISKDSGACDVNVQKVIIDGDTTCNIWHAQLDSAGINCLPEGFVVGDSNCMVMKKMFVVDGDEAHRQIDIMKIGDDSEGEHTTVEVEEADDGSVTLIVTTVDGEVHRIDLDDEDAVERLEALGVQAKVIKTGDGTQCEVFVCSQDGDGATGMIDEMQKRHEAHKDEAGEQLPSEYGLSQNYPNPFNPTTTISYNLAETGHVTLEIFNVNGQRVRTLVDEVVSAGQHSVAWNSTDNNGQKVASGIYMYRLTTGDMVETKKMTLLK